MPLIRESGFKIPRVLNNRHLQTFWANMVRKVPGVNYVRERIHTPDDDFLDLDWSKMGSDTLVIVSHGLEGNSDRPYVRGMVRKVNEAGWDAVAWNFRSCSGEMNRKKEFYHGGSTWDLDTVINHAVDQGIYKRIFLVGFSLGGNLTVNYLGERENDLPTQLAGAGVVSVPFSLEDAAVSLEYGVSQVYMRFFLSEYRRKLELKNALMPGLFDVEPAKTITTLREFDNQYVGPIHGFKNGLHMYEETSCIKFVDGIKLPTLVINALNDPFLGPGCFPTERLGKHPDVFLETPDAGGHVGFMTWSGNWTEGRLIDWFQQLV